MIKVFVHPSAPLSGSELPEERVCMTRAFCFSTFCKALYQIKQPRFLPNEISGIRDDERRVRRIVPGKRFVTKVGGLRERAKNPADQQPWWECPSRRDFQDCRAVSTHLGNVHPAPLPPGGGLERFNAPQRFGQRRPFEEIVHN